MQSVEMTPALANRMVEIRRRFIDGLPERVAAIQAAAGDPEGLGEALRLAHGLVGSGGTFGFPELSVAARSVEAAAKLRQAEDAQDELTTALDALTGAMVRALSDHAAIGAEKVADTAPAPRHSEPEEMLIYLLEDDLDVATDIASQLYAFGYRVTCFSDAGDFQEAAAERRPNALLVDMSLAQAPHDPAALTRIGTTDGRSIPTVFLAGDDRFPARLAAARAGCAGYLVKPIDVAALAERLDTLTRRDPPEPFRVLLVDDDEILIQSYEATLQAAGMLVHLVTDATQTLKAIDSFSPDIVISDLNMPHCSGFELASVIRQLDPLLALPIIFLTSEGDTDNRRTALEIGGDAFLTKPIALSDLIAHVRARAQRARDLRRLMIHDSLTGLLNHAMLLERLGQEVSRAHRDGTAVCFAFIDIDRFKTVNDTHGHPAGDRVIKALSRHLRKGLRRSDVVGRYGGEEFAVIMPGTGPEDAATRIDLLRRQFSEFRHIATTGANSGTNSETFQVSFSAGIAALEPGMTASVLTVKADERLYAAKHNGRDQVRWVG